MRSGEYQFIFDLLGAGLYGRAVSMPKAVNWGKVGRELELQTVAALPADVICSFSGVSQAVKDRWKQISCKHFARWKQLLYVQNQLIQLMERSHIPLVILKGTAAAMYYPAPQCRTMGDIDLLVPRQNYEAALALMVKNGYVLTEQEEHHHTLVRDGIMFKLHRGLAMVSEDAEGKALTHYVRKGLMQREWHLLDEYRMPVMPWLPNGLVLLHHIRQHLRDGLGLRQILDWMMFVEKELHDERYPWFYAAVKSTGLEQLTTCVTRMCQLFLGLEEEGISWCVKAEEGVCRELMAYVMEKPIHALLRDIRASKRRRRLFQELSS